MASELSGIILIMAFAVTAAWCARVALRLWLAGSPGREPERD